jgi:hypothetical protein
LNQVHSHGQAAKAAAAMVVIAAVVLVLMFVLRSSEPLGCFPCSASRENNHEVGLQSRHIIRDEQAGKRLDGHKVFLAIMTRCTNNDVRDTIRKTWGAVAESLDIRYSFFVGDRLATKEAVQQCADALAREPQFEEHHDFGNVVKLMGCREGYQYLPEKTLHTFSHMASYTLMSAHDVEYVAKVDDDVYVDVEALLYRLAEADMRPGQRSENGLGHYSDKDEKQGDSWIYYGFFHNDSLPVQDPNNKWQDPAFPSKAYPPYAGGPFYILSTPVVRWLGQNAPYLNTGWKNEDVSMGSWLYVTNTQRRHDTRFYYEMKYSDRWHGSSAIALHLDEVDGAQTATEKELVVQQSLRDTHKHFQDTGLVVPIKYMTADAQCCMKV